MIEEEREIGKVKIDNDVLASIAGIAALKIPGVYEIATSLVGGIAKFIRKSPDVGIKVVLREGEVSFELSIVVEYGVNIPEVTYQVQKQIKEDVEKMSGLKVSSVDVIVKEIKRTKKEEK